jgi:hypothetical protein
MIGVGQLGRGHLSGHRPGNASQLFSAICIMGNGKRNDQHDLDG